MLDYRNFQNSSENEVIDPVSGNYFPKSLNDLHAERAQVKLGKQEKQFASILASIMK